MPTGSSEQVAADPSATVETPVEGVEAAEEAESVEVSPPQPAEPVAETSRNWADLSEVQEAPEPTGVESTATGSAHPQGSLVEVKEEIHEAESISAVIATIGLPEEVVDELVATEDIEVEASLQDQSFLEQPSDLGNPAEAAFTDIDRAKEEELQQDPSTLPEQAGEFDFADPVESAQVDFAGDDTLEGAEVPEAETEGLIAETSDPTASVPEPAVADTSGTATEANTTCPGEIVPPPTSPNLADPGTEPIQVGHSPASSSRTPRQRVRSSRGGATTRWQEARRAWWVDFEAYQNWLYRNSGGDIARGFWLRKIPYEQATESQRWVIALHSRLVEEFTTSQCLTLAFNIFSSYQSWAHTYGLDRRRGTAHAQQVIDSGDLSPKRIINQRILGAEHPRAEEWDTYYRYVGPQQQPRPKAEKAAAATSVAGAAGGTATAAPVAKQPKEPGHPPPNWQPSLRSPDHPAQPSGPRVKSPKVSFSRGRCLRARRSSRPSS